MPQTAYRDIPQLFFDFIMKAEACKLVGYADGGGTPTNGWGHTGTEVRVGLSISLDVAKINLGSDARIARGKAYLVLSEATILAMSDHQWSAILSFIFNCGEHSTDSIWGVLNARQWAVVPSKLMQYTHEHKNGVLVEVPGLINRRTAEVTLWNAPDADAAAAVVLGAPVAPPPSSYTRDATTPPMTASKPLLAVKHVWAACGAAVCGAPDLLTKGAHYLSSISDTAKPYAADSPLAQQVVERLATAGMVLAIITVVLVMISHHKDAKG